MTSQIETVAVPSLVTALKALQTFVTNLGTDPAQVALKFPGAVQVLIGTLEMQLPGLANAEFSAVQTDVNTKIGALITKLESLAPPAA